MQICPNCSFFIDKASANCPACGKSLAALKAKLPRDSHALDAAPSKTELREAFNAWLERGRGALMAGEYETASAALREAVKRSRILDEAELHEVEARKLLGQAYEGQGKSAEAADQYRIISQTTSDDIMREVWLKKSQDLVASSNLTFDLLFRKEDFRTLIEDEVRFVPLYCSGCKRLLSEAEVYGFRKGFSEKVRCWCGEIERPLAKVDHHHHRSLAEGRGQSQRSRAIEVAGRELKGAKKRDTACLLALTLGFVGVHKFYLGDRVLGWIYVLWCWTLIPFLLSMYEAVVLWHMSMVSFNMTYNLDAVLKEILPNDTEPQSRLDVFSLGANEAEFRQ